MSVPDFDRCQEAIAFLEYRSFVINYFYLLSICYDFL